MAAGEEKIDDFYAVLGLKKECTATELRDAYKKLALRWHPDRCSAAGNSKFVEEAKEKFQSIQEAYSVLSDPNKRFLYDVGVYESDDDENGMDDFLGEMAVMMSQTQPNENGQESFEDLQVLFEEMFQMDMGAFGSTSQSSSNNNGGKSSSCSSSFKNSSSDDNNNKNNKRNCSDMSSAKSKVDFDAETLNAWNFCLGAEGTEESRARGGTGGSGRRRTGRKQKLSSRHEVSSRDAKISA